MNAALETLYYGLEQCGVTDTGRTLFLNAQMRDGIDVGVSSDMTCVQWFKTYAHMLASQGRQSAQRVEDLPESDHGAYDSAFVLIPKNMIEARYLVARAFQFLKPEGMLYCVATNKAGGTRLQKIVQQFGAEIVQQISKHKSRFVQAIHRDIDGGAVDEAIKVGRVQVIDKTGFTAQAGIYGWDKIDKGSALLLQHIPKDLKGAAADFGCGYGYLLQHLLQQNDAVKTAYAIDADARALDVALINMGGDARVQYLWEDLTRPKGIPTRLDTIIMNPPFHEGKKADSDIGVAFIKTAAASLKRNGALYMVANNQLPYETVLADVFFSHELIAQGGGFKVFKAVV